MRECVKHEQSLREGEIGVGGHIIRGARGSGRPDEGARRLAFQMRGWQ